MVVPDADNVGAVGAVVSAVTIVKLVLDISKNIWFEPLIMILFVVPTLFGIVIVSVPSLVVVASIVIG